MGTLILFVLSVPMIAHLLRRRPIAVPPGFWLWLLFLLCVVASMLMLGQTPAGTIPKPASGRLLGVAFNAAGYLAATVVLLYAGNLREDEFPRRRLVGQLGLFFVYVVAGGLLGLLAPRLEFRSVVERLLPADVAANVFVRSLVHPAAAQVQGVLGFESPRPAAPFGFTNIWGYCLALLLGWFVVSWLARDQRPWKRLLGVILLVASLAPVVYSLNRGLWIGLGLVAVLVLLRLAARGHVKALAVALLTIALGVAVVGASPLAALVQERLDNPHSNGIREFTIEKTLDVLEESPVLGFGSTRSALGGTNSIAVGRTAACPLCGNPVLGSTGELWAVLISHGYLGALFYIAFLLRSLWAYRRDRTQIGDAGLIALALPLWFMLIYNALVMPLVITFLSLAVLWRNSAPDPDPPRSGAHDRAPSGRTPSTP